MKIVYDEVKHMLSVKKSFKIKQRTLFIYNRIKTLDKASIHDSDEELQMLSTYSPTSITKSNAEGKFL